MRSAARAAKRASSDGGSELVWLYSAMSARVCVALLRRIDRRAEECWRDRWPLRGSSSRRWRCRHTRWSMCGASVEHRRWRVRQDRRNVARGAERHGSRPNCAQSRGREAVRQPRRRRMWRRGCCGERDREESRSQVVWRDDYSSSCCGSNAACESNKRAIRMQLMRRGRCRQDAEAWRGPKRGRRASALGDRDRLRPSRRVRGRHHRGRERWQRRRSTRSWRCPHKPR